MPDLPQKKVGIIACSGEELAEGAITRLAALKVLEKLRPGDTVTICLPLFLAGGEGDRAFARFYPTIAIDGCEKRCAYRGTEKYSNTPAGSIVVTELVTQHNLGKPEGKRKLNSAGLQAVDAAAGQVAEQVDELLGRAWNRRQGQFAQPESQTAPKEEVEATCACGSGIPIQKINVNGKEMTLIALPLIFQTFQEGHKSPSEVVVTEMMDMLKIYNEIEQSEEMAVTQVIDQEYQAYWRSHAVSHE
jgi:uncharacterized metal-binding protein